MKGREGTGIVQRENEIKEKWRMDGERTGLGGDVKVTKLRLGRAMVGD